MSLQCHYCDSERITPLPDRFAYRCEDCQKVTSKLLALKELLERREREAA